MRPFGSGTNLPVDVAMQRAAPVPKAVVRSNSAIMVESSREGCSFSNRPAAAIARARARAREILGLIVDGANGANIRFRWGEGAATYLLHLRAEKSKAMLMRPSSLS